MIVVDRAPELADHHPPLAIGDQWELVGLLADHRADRGCLEHAVHLVARVRKRVLDDVERYRVDVVLAHEVRELLLGSAHRHRPSNLRMMMFA